MATSRWYLVHLDPRRRFRPRRSPVCRRRWSDKSQLVGPAHRFASRLTDDGFKQGLQDPALDDKWRPSEIQNMKGVRVASSDFLGGLLVTRRLAGKQTGLGSAAVPASEGVASLPAAYLHSLVPIARASQGKVWIATEGPEGVMRGQIVEVDAAPDVQLGDHTGLVSRNGCWLKVELVDQGEIEEYRKELYPSGNDLRPSDVPDVKAHEEPAEDDGDARTLHVDYDEQGHRYKSWRKACQEGTECNFSDAPHGADSRCLSNDWAADGHKPWPQSSTKARATSWR